MKPTEVFDRDTEWSDLDRFVRSRAPGVTVGIVSGRRRAGKSFLLRRHVADGIYHQAIEEGRTPALDRVASLVAGRVGLPAGSVRFTDWLEALEALLRPPMPRVVVLDELPYLLRNSPELPSTIQRLYDDRRSGPPLRLLLCGSSLSVMNSLLVGSRPLRGRATLDLRIGTFDFRTARSYWGIADHETALSIDAARPAAARPPPCD